MEDESKRVEKRRDGRTGERKREESREEEIK